MSEPHAAPAIHLTEATVAFAERHLAFSCAIPAGAAVAVTGPSGAGKSTLFNIIAGFQPLAAGRVELFGEDMRRRDPAERPVSIVFQDNNLFAHLTVGQNVGLGMHPGLRLTATDRETVAAALARVGLAGYEARLPATLSGGERQRVALARAFVRRRPILLLDEPFAALDPSMRSEMIELIGEIRRETRSTMLLITHQPDDIDRVADHAMFLDGGRIAVLEAVGAFLCRREPPALARFLAP
ncbi:thiamine ABC transporter ATP-binding protein [Rhizobium sp. TRM95111]|uniref:thiamine ABC transporter ATP-binding protein n=1 Tax=Rhizobium alarense TaxID=2846851 RepID=UPI001F2F2E06|nr:thiamine ABC transporter ATP-binding protein [Rhizobium alarense]MCF3641195.1 thiamine ABC transporter ATP-binding protein [Rhizobium alarense]